MSRTKKIHVFLIIINDINFVEKYSWTYCVESVVDQMFQIFAHSDLFHQFVLISVHSSQLTNMCEHILKTISKLKRRNFKLNLKSLKNISEGCKRKYFLLTFNSKMSSMSTLSKSQKTNKNITSSFS